MLRKKKYRQALSETIKLLKQEPIEAHWINHKYNGMNYIECSNCSVWFLRHYLTVNNYCPNCGKKMAYNQ